MDEPSQPTIYILAGPNGAGKTTFAKSFLPTFANCREFLNADLIAAGLAPFAPETQAVRASELLLSRIRELVAARATFSFETTLAARSYHASIIEWRRLGYRVVLYFIWLRSAEMAIERVAGRVQQGGHNIPDAVVRRRYSRGLRNLFELYTPIVSNVYVFDGTAFPPILVAEIEGETTLVLDYTRWEVIELQRTTLPMIRHNDPTSLGAKAELAFEDACRNVIERARLSNTKIVICRDGNVVKLTPDEAEQELETNLAKRQNKLPES